MVPKKRFVEIGDYPTPDFEISSLSLIFLMFGVLLVT